MATPKAPKRTVLHVSPARGGDGWELKQERSSERKQFALKAEAIEAGRKRARSAPLGQLIVHRRDGSMQTEWTYGSDPRRSPG